MTRPAPRHRQPARARLPEVALGGELVFEEALPAPWVVYPCHYGAFHGFGTSPDGPFRICSCTQGALLNLVALLPTDDDYERRRVWGQLVALAAAPEPPAAPEDIDAALQFGERLCHRCHLVTPQLRWSHEMYAGQFKQY